MAIAREEGTSSVGDHLQISLTLRPFLVISQAANRAKYPMGIASCCQSACACVELGVFFAD
jgi:hypothetical protein